MPRTLPDGFLYGVCYYPEHWDASRHASDIQRIAAAGFEYIRIGEGAWGYFEPVEGQYRFDLFDNVLNLCRKHGLKVIFGTPTYCGPAWIARNYPEVLRYNFQRIPMEHGSRRNYNYTSPKYIELSDKICTALAEHYRREKQIFAWQLDNEFNCHMDVSYAPSDEAAFRIWLQEKYGTIEKLNKAWGTAFWSQQYNDWSQILLPHPTAAHPNPSHLLDESRFISDMVCRFARRQADILRKANPKWLITHNHLFANVDGPKLVHDGGLDFFSHDQYPLFTGEGNWTDYAHGLHVARSLSFPYAVMEQQSGPGGQLSYLHRTPRQGQQRLFTWQSIAHGAKALSYFRWRTCPYGAEQHWHGLIDQDDRDSRRLAEAKTVGSEIARLPKALWDAPVARAVAVMRDYDNDVNDTRINTYIPDGRWELGRWIGEFAGRQIPTDIVWPSSNLKGYKILILPHLKIVDKALVEKVTAFAQAGGVVVLGAQSGLKDRNCHIVEAVLPGLWRKVAGVEVEDWTMLDGKTRPVKLGGDRNFTLSLFAERLKPTRGTEVLATWDTDDTLLAGAPAITRAKVGKGSIIYVGGYCPSEATDTLADELMEMAGLSSLVDATPRVEAISRDSGKHKYLFLMNHSTKPEQVRGLPEKCKELLTAQKVAGGTLTLPAYGVAIVES